MILDPHVLNRIRENIGERTEGRCENNAVVGNELSLR